MIVLVDNDVVCEGKVLSEAVLHHFRQETSCTVDCRHFREWGSECELARNCARVSGPIREVLNLRRQTSKLCDTRRLITSSIKATTSLEAYVETGSGEDTWPSASLDVSARTVTMECFRA